MGFIQNWPPTRDGDGVIFQIQAPKAQQLQPPPQPPFPLTGDTALGVGATSLIVGLAILWFRRRISRDGLEIAKDRAEGGMVDALLKVNKNLTEENERLMQVAQEAWAVRNADATRIATLETELMFLRRDMEALRPAVQRSTDALTNSGLMPLHDMKDDP